MSVKVVKPNVVLVASPRSFQGTRISGIAAKTCTSAESFAEILDTHETYKDVLKRVINYGHLSVTEFDQWIFGIEGVSRTFTHQLVRKRVGVAYAQESMRYASQGGAYQIIVPSSLEGKSYPVSLFDDPNPEQVYLSLEGLAEVVHQWYEEAQKDGVPNEDARFGLLEASKTKILVGMNSHALLDWFKERCCSTAQWEIRAVANMMLKRAQEVDPTVFASAGPKCCYTGVCNEPKSKWENCKRVPHNSKVKNSGTINTQMEEYVNSLSDGNKKLLKKLLELQ